jgi:DNA-binding transcriptional MerR regulator
MYGIKELAEIAGITSRALRHYDAIGLLKPARVGENGYRYYGPEELLRLQRILFLRETEMPLAEIARALDSGRIEEALAKRLAELEGRIERLKSIAEAVRRALPRPREDSMGAEELVGAFRRWSPEEEDAMAKEAEALYDPQVVRESNRRWKAYGRERQDAILAEGRAIYEGIAARMGEGPDSPGVLELIGAWRTHMNYFWTPSLEQLVALAEGYARDERFRANLDLIAPGLAEFMGKAAKAYAARASAAP